jgi:hypothetical protein
MVVALALLGLLGGAVFTLVISGFSAQRNTLSMQKSTNQLSFVAEYMGRALRQAQKELNSPATCLVNAGRGWNYEVSAGNDSVTFLDKNGICRKLSISGDELVEEISTDHQAANFNLPQPLTPASSMKVTKFRVVQMGANQTDALQPRITFVIEAEGEESAAKIRIQTTVSQRNFDVVQ